MKKELERLQRRWGLVYWRFRGRDLDAATELATAGDKTTITYSGNRFVVKVGERIYGEGTEEIDHEASPATFISTVTRMAGQPRGDTRPGIYLVRDNLFIACVGFGGKKPTAFAADSGDKTELVIIGGSTSRLDALRRPPMCRFTIRDVLWLTVVAAVVLGWLANWRIQVARYHKLEAEMQEARYYWGTVVADRDRFQTQALDGWQQAELFRQFAHDLQHHAQQNGFDVKIDSGRAVLVRRQAGLDEPNGNEPYAPRSSRLKKGTSP